MTNAWVSTGHAYIKINYSTGTVQVRSADSPPPAGTSVTAYTVPTASWGTMEAPAVLEPPLPTPWPWRLSAIPAVALVAAAGRGRFTNMVRLARSGRSFKPATDEQAARAVRAVRWATRYIPGRWACLEESVTASLLLAGLHRRAEWRHGLATDPIRLHAWIAGRDGQPIEEPPSTNAYVVTCTPDGPVANATERTS